MIKDDVDRLLFQVLTAHDVAVDSRQQQRRLEVLGDKADDMNFFVWPDLSDIHTTTRERIRRVMEGKPPFLPPDCPVTIGSDEHQPDELPCMYCGAGQASVLRG